MKPRPDAAIELRSVSKRFGRVEALRGVDLTFAPGRIAGLVGPNAAGKSTIFKSILGLTTPDAGEIRIHGARLNGDPAYRRGIGYMPQAARFPENLTGHEVLALLSDLRGPSQAADDAMIGRLGLAGELGKKVRTLSGGTRQKLNAAAAFLFRPTILILDEPTAGLDPVASGAFKEKLWEARAAGAAVVLASHTLSELEELADDIVFLLEGRVRYQGTAIELAALTGYSNLERALASLMGDAA